MSMPLPDPRYTGMTLQEAIDWLHAQLEEGAACPCCRQFAKIYERKLNNGMVRGLIWLVNMSAILGDDGWVPYAVIAPVELQRNREFAKLVHWGLIEPKLVESERGGRTSGIWRPTQRGREFVYMRCKVPRAIRLYNGTFLSYVDTADLITPAEAIGDYFEYNELMG